MAQEKVAGSSPVGHPAFAGKTQPTAAPFEGCGSSRSAQRFFERRGSNVTRIKVDIRVPVGVPMPELVDFAQTCSPRTT